MSAASEPEAVLTLHDMTSDAQTPLAHATMLHGTSGFQWHMPKTCDMSMDCVLCHIVALRVAPSVVTETCRWVLLHNRGEELWNVFVKKTCLL